MKPRVTHMLSASQRAHPDKPDMATRVIAGLAVIAWLLLAGDAFAQDNQWAPNDAVTDATPAPSTGGTGGPVWGTGPAADQFAPVDLDQRLSEGGTKTGAALAPPTPAPAPADPTYAPPGTATSRTAPLATPGAAPQAGYPAQQPYPGQAYGATPYPNGGFAYPGVQSQPQYQLQPGYGAPYPGISGYGLPYVPLGAAAIPGASGYGLPYGYGTGLPLSPGAWGAPYGGYGGTPFFGASPFGFW